MKRGHIYFHLHLVSDSTGETLLTVGRAAAARYESIAPIEHVYPLVRSMRHLDRVISDIEASPGIVLYTLVERDLGARIEEACKAATLPCVNVLDPIVDVFRSYLNLPATGKAGAQHALDAEYFKRIDALNFTMMHDDGQLPENIEDADIILIGVSRTSKTPTSIYLANRGVRATNMPLVPGVAMPQKILDAKRPLVVGLIASPERIMHIRQNRLLSLNAADQDTPYVDKTAIAQEVAYSRRLCSENNWPMIDVTRRSIEETAAAILALYDQHRYGKTKEPFA
ncbi:pyruvate, water dikinase regulatory protein [Chthonobacter albigriseus]|uniref:pyruvate, water dikinase regulatory protein n=1 Tax=Chthonobacter albigriseus TaxID=1683161 RepID=UPI0015EF99F8|nr:pyruvate, water dikinase regulatory protein [Chthonobacter albigriseus]